MAETKLTITPEEITAFSLTKNEPEWFLQTRLKGLELAKTLELPFIERVKFHVGTYSNQQSVMELQ